jgi:mRNA interferase RelE/StbE
MEAPAYTVEIIGAARRELRRIERTQQDRLRAAIRALARKPRPQGCRKLTGAEDLYRLRVGEYRVVYQIEDERLVVLVVRIRHRRDAYR